MALQTRRAETGSEAFQATATDGATARQPGDRSGHSERGSGSQTAFQPGDTAGSQPGQPGDDGQRHSRGTQSQSSERTTDQTHTDQHSTEHSRDRLFTCPDCDGQFDTVSNHLDCPFCNTKLAVNFNNGQVYSRERIQSYSQTDIHTSGVRTLLHYATMTETKAPVIKKTAISQTVCLDCYTDLQDTLSVRVSKFSHVGKRDIQEKTYPYMFKTLHFPVYIKGRICEGCAKALTPSTKIVNEGRLDETTIGIWLNPQGVEIHLLIEIETNRVTDTQSMKSMDREIREGRDTDSRDSYRLMRIPGFDEPIVLAHKELNEKVDVQSYNALFGKRQVNRYGRHVIEPNFNDREK